MRKIHGAVVGLGYWGPNLVRNFLKIPGVTLRACDTSEKSLKNFHKEYPFVPVTNDFTDIIKDSSIKFVSIATPLSTHYPLAKQALLAGKHVLLEKPMTKSSKEAKELIQIAEKNKRVLMVGHTFVYSEAVRRVKKIISNEKFGKVFYFDSTRINLGRFQSDTNVIWDLAPHDFSIVEFLFDEKPYSIHVLGSSHLSKKTLETAHIFLNYTHNVTAHIYVSWLSPVKMRKILIGGSKQMIEYDDIQPTEKIRTYNKSFTLSSQEITPFLPAYRSGAITIPHIPQKEALFTQLSHFIDCIQTNRRPLTDGQAGLRVVQLLKAADKSLLTKKATILYDKK